MGTRIPFAWRVRAIAAATVLPIALEMVSFERLERAITALGRGSLGNAPGDDRAARWVDDALANRPWPWRRSCLRRATVLYYLLRRAGRRVELCIGVRRDEQGVLQAHAWLLRDGEPYLEPDTTAPLVPTYGVIARFPSETASA